MKKIILSSTKIAISLSLSCSGLAPAHATDTGIPVQTTASITTAAAAAKTEEVSNLEISATHQIFRKYIKNSLVRNAFRATQWQLLNTASDSALTYFFRNRHPILTELFNELSAEHEREVEEFSMMAQTNMAKITRGLTPKYDKLIKMIEETASDHGASQEAIDNLELYLMDGDVNAFTVSGNEKRLIVVVQSGLLDKLDNPEVRPVLGHEIGHILSLHSLQGQMSVYMMNILGLSLAKTGLSPNNFAAKVQLTAEMIDYDNIENRSLIAESIHSAKVIAAVKMKAKGINKKKASGRAQLLFKQTLSKVQSLPPEESIQLLSEYIFHLMHAMTEMNASPEALKYFYDLYKNMSNLGSVLISMEQFAEHASAADDAVSRTDETSADFYASSGNPNENIASAFGKLLGLVFTHQKRTDIFKGLQKQAADFIAKHTDAERSPYMGSSHPALILRINNILNMPSYPAVLFANPFLKLLVLESSILQSLGKQTAIAEIYDKHHKELQNVLSHDELNEKDVAKALAKFNYFEQNLKRSMVFAQTLQTQHSLLVTDIVASVARLGLSNKMNPRFSNLIEHYSYLRETELNAVEISKKQLADSETGDDEKQFLQNQLSTLNQSLNTPAEVLVVLKSALAQEIANTNDKRVLPVLNQRLDAINMLLTAESPQMLEDLRIAFVPKRVAGSVADRRRIPKQTPQSKALAKVCTDLLK